MNARQWMVGILAVLFSFAAFTQYVGPSQKMASTVAEALKASDDTPVVLEGFIISQIRRERYEFKDSTGTIILDVDDDIFWPAKITQTDKVRIYGEVDKEIFGTKIEVKHIELISRTAK